ncbi:MAG TPA: Mur ligase family protein [Steroidobacteraceae bacterium]|nr:Mur ligase family protein [Steroidobacteraceae bacterium]
MLETEARDPAVLDAWRGRVLRACGELRWPAATASVVPHETGASLALAAPPDQLYTATEVNEWALAASIAERDPASAPALIAALAAEQPEETEAPALETAGAMLRLRRRAARESNPRLRALIEAAMSRGLPHVLDDETLTLGAGAGSYTWPLAELPEPAAVDWSALRAIPTALVTGTNGKTTVVRLLAACAKAAGLTTGYCCTDGVFVAGRALGTGDYSGPAGARRVLRDPHAEAAILETARGGILRRGLAVARADVAVITSIAADHFGEYGVHDLEALVEVKLAVARALDDRGLLVVNADDHLLARRAPACGKPLGWFAQDADSPFLATHRQGGGATAGVRGGRLVLFHGRAEHDLGAVAEMPLAAGGHSHFNVANLATAALGAAGLGIAPATIAAVFAGFGASPEDNAGRLMRYELGGLNLIVDFAHNPTALSGLVDFAQHLRGDGRLALLLGQAGDREDADIDRLAAVAAAARPDLVVVKELGSYLRGRGTGEIPALLRRALAGAGLRPDAIGDAPDEDRAVRVALAWARAGDVLVLPLHSRDGRGHALALFERLRREGWRAGQPLPD